MGHSKAQRGLQRRHRALNADPTKEGGEKAWRGTENKQKPESEGEQIHLLSAEILHVAQIHIRTGQGEPEL